MPWRSCACTPRRRAPEPLAALLRGLAAKLASMLFCLWDVMCFPLHVFASTGSRHRVQCIIYFLRLANNLPTEANFPGKICG